MQIPVSFTLSDEDVMKIILLATAKDKVINLEHITSLKKLKEFVAAHLYSNGRTMLNKPFPDELLLRRQDVLAALKGIYPVGAGGVYAPGLK